MADRRHAGGLDLGERAGAQRHQVRGAGREEAVDRRHRNPVPVDPGLHPLRREGRLALDELEPEDGPRREPDGAQHRHQQPRLADRASLARGEREQRVVAAARHRGDLVGDEAEERAQAVEPVLGDARPETLEEGLHLGRVARELARRARPARQQLGRRLARDAARQRRRDLGELHAEAVHQLVHAREAPAPDADAIAVLGADREEQPVRRRALVEDDLAAARAGQRRPDAAAAPRPARRDLELDAPEPFGVGGDERKLEHHGLPQEEGEAAQDEQEAHDRPAVRFTGEGSCSAAYSGRSSTSSWSSATGSALPLSGSAAWRLLGLLDQDPVVVAANADVEGGEAGNHHLVERHPEHPAVVGRLDDRAFVRDRIGHGAEHVAHLHGVAQLDVGEEDTAVVHAHPTRPVVDLLPLAAARAGREHALARQQLEHAAHALLDLGRLEAHGLARLVADGRDPDVAGRAAQGAGLSHARGPRRRCRRPWPARTPPSRSGRRAPAERSSGGTSRCADPPALRSGRSPARRRSARSARRRSRSRGRGSAGSGRGGPADSATPGGSRAG